MAQKKVVIIGGGVAGLSAALALEQVGIAVDLLEKTGFLGGHGIQYACKATDQCVKCGACVVEDTLKQVVANANIHIHLNSQIQHLSSANGCKNITFQRQSPYIDPQKCTNCGQCYDQCPHPGAIERGFSSGHHPFYALDANKCQHFTEENCRVCEDSCPEKAIFLDSPAEERLTEVDAVITATGFKAFEPFDKPYGWGTLANVITNLELERMLRRHGGAIRPSDGRIARRIAFIQCVGSRDASLNHSWCSRVCCGSVLRMARVIKARHADSDIHFFYLDVQNFGKDFEKFYAAVQKDIIMVRCLPGDIYPTSDDCLRVAWYDSRGHQNVEEVFDLVVLSVGMTPQHGSTELADQFKLELDSTGFLNPIQSEPGMFIAGAVAGPMAIDETIASAKHAVWQTIQYLKL